MQRARFFYIGGCVLGLVGLMALISAVREHATRSGSPVQFNSMENSSETLAQLKVQTSFQAEVLSVFVRESTNMAAEHGITNRTSLVTNLYAVRFRGPDGQARVVSGMNATSDEIRSLKQLHQGKVYAFPEVFMK